MVDKIGAGLLTGLVCLLVLLFCSTVSTAGETSRSRPVFINAEVGTSTDIHFSRHYCAECHMESEKQDYMSMRYDDYTATCRCHNYTPETYTHPVGIKVSAEKKAAIPANFPLENDTITCATCHDIALQCQPESEFKKSNRAFLRVSPLLSRTAICFQCHDEAKYRMLDPHNQLDKDGNIVEEKCLYCHKRLPDMEQISSGNDEDGANMVVLIGKLDVLCYRCHYQKIKLHPINANHLKKPSARIYKNMRRSERKLGIILPLDSQGKITCVTCHNPHEHGVMPENIRGAQGAGERGRLRAPRRGDKICLACHYISLLIPENMSRNLSYTYHFKEEGGICC